MRHCSRCGTERDATEFYARSAQCKPCVRARVKQHRLANLDAVREYDRRRALLPHRIANAIRVTAQWRAKHKGRSSAQTKAERAHRTAPECCEGCSQKRRVERHHPDYNRPLLVVWLCKPCHAIADKIRRKVEAVAS